MPLFPRGDPALAVSATSSSDKPGLERMIDAARWRHLHLDWFDPLLLIEETPFLKLTNGRRLVACLGCPPEGPRRAWIRVFAVSHAVELHQAWDHLWPAAAQAATTIGVNTIDVLLSASWMATLVEADGFSLADEVVFLEQENVHPLPGSAPLGTIRPVTSEDLPALLSLDAQAFPEPWRMSQRSLQAACRSSAYASLIEHQHEILGYQITSRSPYSAHLSRLAVATAYTRCGLGTALTQDALRTLGQQASYRWTVNTQASNQPALALYQQLGFRPSGVRYPMHTIQL
jgi:[ribosomal protein S18]-alanine N-acetyltransferase